jgi:hypothetical protein
MTLGIFFFFAVLRKNMHHLMPFGPRTVYSPRRYIPPFAARPHIRLFEHCRTGLLSTSIILSLNYFDFDSVTIHSR